MAVLTINANDTENAVTIQVRYRILNSNGTYTMVNLTPGQLPYTSPAVQNGQYEVGVRNLCSNGAYSPWIIGQSGACPSATAFSVTRSGSNFVVNATVPTPQTKVQVQVTDPNGGVQVYSHDFAAQVGTFNIPVTSGLTGNYSFAISAICDDTVSPVYASLYSSSVTVNIPANGNALVVKLGNTTTNTCSSAAVTVYSTATSIVPGIVVYYDSALTLTVDDVQFIAASAASGAIVYAINTSGVVGASSGTNC